MIFLDGIIYSIQQSGGISVYFSELVKRLNSDQQDINFSCYSNNNHFFTEYNFSKIAKLYKTRILERYRNLKIDNKADVFHSSYYRLPTNKKGVKIITTVHDFTYEKFFNSLQKIPHSLQKKNAILNSDVVVCISESTKADMLKYIPKSSKLDIRVVNNGVSSSFKHLPEITMEHKLLYVGSRFGYKNFKSFIEASALLPEYKVTLIGGGELSSEETQFLEAKIPKRWSHSVYVTEKELNDHYNSSFCFVYPSLYEGFGIPAIEAMQAGCPVIASNTSSLPEVCGNSGILLDEMNGNTIAEAIKEIEKRREREKFISKGLINAQRFSWDLMYSEMKQIYHE